MHTSVSLYYVLFSSSRVVGSSCCLAPHWINRLPASVSCPPSSGCVTAWNQLLVTGHCLCKKEKGLTCINCYYFAKMPFYFYLLFFNLLFMYCFYHLLDICNSVSFNIHYPLLSFCYQNITKANRFSSSAALTTQCSDVIWRTYLSQTSPVTEQNVLFLCNTRTQLGQDRVLVTWFQSSILLVDAV